MTGQKNVESEPFRLISRPALEVLSFQPRFPPKTRQGLPNQILVPIPDSILALTFTLILTPLPNPPISTPSATSVFHKTATLASFFNDTAFPAKSAPPKEGK